MIPKLYQASEIRSAKSLNADWLKDGVLVQVVFANGFSHNFDVYDLLNMFTPAAQDKIRDLTGLSLKDKS